MTYLSNNQILLRQSSDRCFPFILDICIAKALGNQASLRVLDAKNISDQGSAQLLCTRSGHISIRVSDFVKHYMDATSPAHIVIDLGFKSSKASFDAAIANAESFGKSVRIVETVQYHRRINGYIFGIYIDRIVKWLDGKFGRKYESWPPIANFARTVRNAIIHGGIIRLSKGSPIVSWRGLQLSHVDDGQNIFGEKYIYDGDLIMLMYELEEELIENDAPFDF